MLLVGPLLVRELLATLIVTSRGILYVCVCPQLWGQISQKPKELGGKIHWGAYRKVVRGYWMV